MKPIVTVTLNPCVDGACETDAVRATHKIRTSNMRHDPGGGGVNVARVVTALGGKAAPVYFRGGPTGALLDRLLEEYGFDGCHPLEISEETRLAMAVYERSSGAEFRFVPEGPKVTADEWGACLRLLNTLDYDWLVASGSSPRGFSKACYSGIAALAVSRGAKFVLDSSGPSFATTLELGGVALAKPSIGEFRALTGEALTNQAEVERAARVLIDDQRVEMLAITMGHEGAMLVWQGGALHRMPPDVPVKSAVGAGDSFLGAMVLSLAQGADPKDAFLMGMAAGSAAVITPGTELCTREDVERLRASMT